VKAHGLALFLMLLPHTAMAQPAAGGAALAPAANYQAIRTWHEQHLATAPDRAARVEALRRIVRSGQLGERGLQRIFNNFEGRGAIDPTIPGVEKTARLLASSNRAQVKGHTRELLYALRLHNDGRHSLIEMGRRLVRPWGRTDADLFVRHQTTGLYGRVEVKDYSLRSQLTNEARLKVQMRKMAREGRLTGQPQFWINRHAMTPQLRLFAARSGLVSMESVATGRRLPAGAQSFDQALARMDREFARVASRRAWLGGAMWGFGAAVLANSLPNLWAATFEVARPGKASLDARLRLVSSGSYSFGGAGLIASGSALAFGARFGEVAQARIFRFGRAGGVVSVAALATGLAIDVYRYQRGSITTEELWEGAIRSGIQASSAAAGGWVGSVVGGAVGGPLGSSGGAIAGGMAGGKLADLAFEKSVQAKRDRLDQAFGDALNARYGLVGTPRTL
jgi:hypothetical protein